MRQHICKKCGKIYLTDKPDSWYCPECAEESRRNVMRDKTCAMCGKSFVGYPRSKYCPDCRIIAKREAQKRHRTSGTSRKIGSIDHCANCGKEYVVFGSLQRYCPECAKTVVSDTVKQQKRQWAEEHRADITSRKAELRKDRRVCAVCGKPFTSPLPTVTCSPECAREHKRQKQAIQDVKRGRANPQRILQKKSNQTS